MSLKRHIECELRFLLSRSKCVIISCIGTLAFGVFTWLSCDGIGIVWKTARLPSCSLPLFVIFTLSTAAYLLYGVLIALSVTYGYCTTLPVKALVSFVLLLFWCPLTLVAGVGLSSFASVAISILYLLFLGKRLIRHSVIGLIFVTLVIVFELYLLFFSVAFTIIN